MPWYSDFHFFTFQCGGPFFKPLYTCFLDVQDRRVTGVKSVFQGCYKGVIFLDACYEGVSGVLQSCFRGVKGVSHGCQGALEGFYRVVTGVRGIIQGVTGVLSSWYVPCTFPLYCIFLNSFAHLA